MSRFVRRKLCKETLDTIVLKHVNDKHNSNSRKIPYTLASGKTVEVVPESVAFDDTPFEYLLGQTFPYHERRQREYPITSLLFRATKDGGKEPWTRDPKDLQFFIQVGLASGTLPISKRT